MAVLQTLDIARRAQREGYLDTVGVSSAQANPIFDIAKQLLAKEFWQWYGLHSQDKIYGFRFLFISKTIRVSDIRFVFVLLFGEPQ